MDESDLGRWVVPFYLETMGLNAVDASSALLEDLVAAGSTLSSSDITDLLNGGWRGVAVGSWYALLSNDARVHEAVLAILAGSSGDLTAPGLCVTAIVLTGESCVEALCEYARRDLGACGFIAAALSYIGAPYGRCSADADDRRYFDRLLGLAQGIRARHVACHGCADGELADGTNLSPHRVGRKGATSCAQVNVIGGGACAGRSMRATYEPQ